MKCLLFIVLVLCVIFPVLGTTIINRLFVYVPLIEALMPCFIVVAGIYLIVKSVLK